MHSYTPAEKPILTEEAMEKRMEYALRYADEPQAFWEQVVFCDEKWFSSATPNNDRVWRPPRARYFIY